MNDDVFPPPDDTKPDAAFAVAYERGVSAGMMAALIGVFAGAAIARRLLGRRR